MDEKQETVWKFDPTHWPNVKAVKLEERAMGNATKEDIPRKAARFGDFYDKVFGLMLEGTDKYTGAQRDEWETIDVMPKAFGEEGYRHYIYNDILKRLIRYKNQHRERDLFKIALWVYLLWMWEKDNGTWGEEKSHMDPMGDENMFPISEGC